MTAHEALRQCIEAMKLVDFKDCAESEALWHQFNMAQANAERVLKSLPLTDAEIEAAVFPPRAQLKAEDWDPATKRPRPAQADRVLRDGENQEPVAYRTTFNDFRNFSGATVSGRDYVQFEKPIHDSRFFEGCDSLVVTPLYDHPAPSLREVGVALEGWQLVPIKPTKEMCEALLVKGTDDIYFNESLWRGMLNAAPQPPAASCGDVERDLALRVARAALKTADSAIKGREHTRFIHNAIAVIDAATKE